MRAHDLLLQHVEDLRHRATLLCSLRGGQHLKARPRLSWRESKAVTGMLRVSAAAVLAASAVALKLFEMWIERTWLAPSAASRS